MEANSLCLFRFMGGPIFRRGGGIRFLFCWNWAVELLCRIVSSAFRVPCYLNGSGLECSRRSSNQIEQILAFQTSKLPRIVNLAHAEGGNSEYLLRTFI